MHAVNLLPPDSDVARGGSLRLPILVAVGVVVALSVFFAMATMRTPRGPFSPAGRQRLKRPARHSSHVRQAGTMQNATWSPGATWVTAAPTASTIPAPSWPMRIRRTECRRLSAESGFWNTIWSARNSSRERFW